MVGVAGFEPATPASRTQCSTGLSHTPTWNAAYSLGYRRPQAAGLRKLITVDIRPKTQILPAGEAAVAAAARALAAGGLVAFPTETVYGLGADATNPAAIARLYQAKGRPAFNPLITHVGDIAAARKIARFDAPATALAEAFWPGPLTLVLPKTHACAVADLATAGLDTIAIRILAHPVARDIRKHLGPRLADHRRACAKRPCGADRPDRRWRAGRRRRRIHDCRLLRCADAAASRRPAARGDRARAGPRACAAA